jgi:lipoprotein-anchoring transpeptidase ErfK/SrfK
MRTRLIVLAAFLATLALGGVAAAYAYDHSKRDRIADGVAVNGVQIGGLAPAQAEAKLRATLLDPLAQPVKVRYHHRTFTLTPKQASVGIDIHGTVAKALARSREGNMFTRAWRNARGESINAQLAADVTYSQPAIRKLVKRVQRKLNKPAKDAALDLSTGEVAPTHSQTGVRVKFNTLAKDLEKTLLARQTTKTVKVHTKTVDPTVTDGDLAKKYPSIVIVDRGSFRLTLYKGLKVAKTYGIAVGQVGLETPAGLYKIENMAVNPSWHVPNSAWAGDLAGKVIPPGPDNPIQARWMGIYAGAGIHGTTEDGSIGTAASHGCIRMHIPDVIDLYDQVSVGTPVYIA